MANRDQKQTNRLSLSLSLLSPKKKKATTPNRTIYISRPLNSFGPSGQSLGVHTDDVMLPLRVYCEIFGPSVNYKSVGVNHSTSAWQIIQNLFQKMSKAGEPESDSLREFCLVEICTLTEFAYLRLLEDTAYPLLLYQQHSKRYKSSDNWKLKLILRSHLKFNANLMMSSFKRDRSLVCVSVNCHCLEDSFLSVGFLLSPSASCEKIINKVVTEFAYTRQPDDFSIHCTAVNSGTNDQLPISITLDYLHKQIASDVIELILRYKYDDITYEYELSDTDTADEAVVSSREVPTPKHRALAIPEQTRNVFPSLFSDQPVESADVWVEYYDSTREKIYYINSETEEILWIHPSTQQEMYIHSDMPPGWVRGVDRESGRVFYQNTFDKKIEWSHPLRHLHRIYKKSLQPVSNSSLPRPTSSFHKPPSRCPPPPPVPLSARPTLGRQIPGHTIHRHSRSLGSSKQSVSEEVERTSSDALLTEFDTMSGRHKAQRKNKRLNNLRRLLVNEKYSDDSDTGSGYKIKSLFAPTNRRKETEGALMPGISVTVTPDPSPAGRKKSIVSVGSNTSERSMPISTLSSLPRNFSAVRSSQGYEEEHRRSNSFDTPELPDETAVIYTQQNVTEASAYQRSVSETEQKHTAVTALDEAFSLLDGSRTPDSDVYSFRKARTSAEVIVNKNAHASDRNYFARREEVADNSLNNCFEVINDSSFDEGSDQEMFCPAREYTVVVEPADSTGDSYAGEGPVVSDISVANKISHFEQQLHGGITRDMNASLSVPAECVEGQSSGPRDRSGSVSSDTGSLRSEDTGSVDGGRTKNALRTRKGRMSRNTSALNHQELEQLNKGTEPQKSILKHSRSDIEANSDRKSKGVSFLSTSVQMIEIERRKESVSSSVPELDTQSVIHRRGVSNWRDMLKNFYDEVDSPGGVGDLVWSPDEGIGLGEEDRFITEANKLTANQELSREQAGSLRQPLRDSPPIILDPQPPQLPPRPTPDDIDNISNSGSSRSPSTHKASQDSIELVADTPDEETPFATRTNTVTREMETVPSVAGSVTDSIPRNKIATETGSPGDNSGVTDSGLFSLEVSTNLDDISPRRGDISLSLTQLVFDTLSGTLSESAASREPFTSLSMVPESPSRAEPVSEPSEEPVVVSSLVEPLTPNAMIPMNVFLPKERPTLLREQLRTHTPLQQINQDSPREEVPSNPIFRPSPIPNSPSAPYKHLHTLSKTRSASPVLVDQLNKPLSGTPFVHGYQYQRKPANKSTTLYSGYLALLEQQQTSEFKQKAKKYSH